MIWTHHRIGVVMATDADLITEFRDAMEEHDILIDFKDIIADGRIHRVYVAGDRKGSKNGWFILFLDGQPSGAFGCNKRYGEKVKFKWSHKSKTPLTSEERRAFSIKMSENKAHKIEEERLRHETAAVFAQSAWDAAAENPDHPYLERKTVQHHGTRVGKWFIVDHTTGEAKLVSNNALLIPMRDTAKKIHSLQAIFPNKQNMLRRDKDFLAGGCQEGKFFTIGKPRDKTFIIGEGFATCATIHEITAHAVVVAFTRGNIINVARILREKFPDYTIIIAADNDQWTTEPVNNPGLTDARAAAIAIKGLLAVPPFTEEESSIDETGKRIGPTDFNDLAVLHGNAAVLAEFEKPFDPSIQEPEAEEAPPPWHDASMENVTEQDVPAAPAPATGGSSGDDDDDLPADVRKNVYFAMLGYDHERYYIFQFEKRQIMCFTKSDFSDGGLIELAPLNWWEGAFPGNPRTGGIDKKMAMNAMIRYAHRQGIYDMSRVRGRGAWTDKNRSIFHHGGYLSVDGVRTDITDLKSRFVYELSRSLPDISDTPLTDEDGKKVLEIMTIFRWAKPGSAALLAGWVALAPLCGAVRWRPHAWITGGAGSGKSTVLELVHFLMNGMDLYAQGSSSEAGIRQELKGDALPVLFDESESNTEREAMRVQSILALIRQASTESQARTLKGSAGGDAVSFHIRSMFCLASIQVGIKYQADIERMTVLSLLPKRDDLDAAGTWKKMAELLHTLRRDEDMPGRLVKRSIDLLPTTRQNIKIFSEVAATKFGSQRDGDQYGTLLAGAWSLISREVATLEQAAEMVEEYDWSEHRENNEDDEGERAISALMEAHIRVPGGAEVTVFELLKVAMLYEVKGFALAHDACEAILARHGMRIDGTYLLLSNRSNELRRLMQGTPFEADLRGVMLRVKGSIRWPRPVKFSGVSARCIAIPVGDLVKDDYIDPEATVAF